MNWLKAGGTTVVAGLVLLLAWRATRGAADSPDRDSQRSWEPLPRSVSVEVFNGGDTPGAARDAALRLRRARIDVVDWSNAPESLRDTSIPVTRILVRRGDTTGVGRVAEVLGATEVIDQPDERRLVDLTVIVPRGHREPETSQ